MRSAYRIVQHDRMERLRLDERMAAADPGWLRVALYLSWTTLFGTLTWVALSIAERIAGGR